MIEFPDIANDADFACWRSAPDRWLPVVRMIARLTSIPASVLSPFSTGTNLVVDLDGGMILKLFPPIYRSQFTSERATLRRLAGRLAVPIPSIVVEGEACGWSWLVIDKLKGIVGSDAWPVVPERAKQRILEEIGRTIADVQSVPLGELATIEPKWPDFIEQQVAGCVERHRRQGLSEWLLSDLHELLSEVPSVIPLDAPSVILTGEWIPENFLLSEEDGRWKLAAVIDFGDVMTGWREYDLLGPSAFMCAGMPGRIRSLLQGYGLAATECDRAMRRRLLTLMVLHRASDLRNIYIDGWENRIDNLLDLADVVWPEMEEDSF